MTSTNTDTNINADRLIRKYTNERTANTNTTNTDTDTDKLRRVAKEHYQEKADDFVSTTQRESQIQTDMTVLGVEIKCPA